MMPEELEKKLKRSGRKKGFVGERLNKYVYGALRRLTGWKPSHQKKSKTKYKRSK